jgi:D-glycero-alpha-D-manno-heptose-7-phosphate kinase
VLITRTPLRVSFFGGGSDLKSHYGEFGGSVLSTSIDKYVYISAHQLHNDDSILLKYSRIEYVSKPDDLKHPIVKEVLLQSDLRGIDIGVTADVPAGTGLGSSSAFTVGLINLVSSFKGKYLTPDNLARLACETEIEKLQEPIGKQDQYATAFGGLNLIRFNPDDSVEMIPIFLSAGSKEYLEKSLVLVRVGKTRSASKILRPREMNPLQREKGIVSLKRLSNLAEENAQMLDLNPERLGEVLLEAWKLKVESKPRTTNSLIDSFINEATSAGATGAKLLGAGQAGFVLLQIPPKKMSSTLRRLGNPITLPFSFENTGSRVIYAKK